MSYLNSMVSSKTNEWATPKDLFIQLDKEFGFTLDPCSTHENYKVAKHYTIEDDGLAQDWSGEIVYMNPPYGGSTAEWIEKALYESKKGATVVCLIVSSTSRHYWHDIIFPYAAQIRFFRGRLKFNDGKPTAPFASALVVFTDKIKYKERFIYHALPLADDKANREVGSVSKEIILASDPVYRDLDEEFNFTLTGTSLQQDWTKNTVFMIPQVTENANAVDWLKKALNAYKEGSTVVCLLPVSTDRSYWHDIIFPYAAQIRFVRGRIKFNNSDTATPYSSALIVFTSKYEYEDKVVYYDKSVSDALLRGEKLIPSSVPRRPKVPLFITF